METGAQRVTGASGGHEQGWTLSEMPIGGRCVGLVLADWRELETVAEARMAGCIKNCILDTGVNKDFERLTDSGR